MIGGVGGGFFCQCEWGSGSVAGPVGLRVDRPMTGAPGGSSGWVGGWTSKVNSRGGVRDGGPVWTAANALPLLYSNGE